MNITMILDGLGVSLLPSSLARDARQRGAVVRSVRPRLTRRVGLLHRPGDLSPAASALVELAVAWAITKPGGLDLW